MDILVIGLGSMGRRRIRLLKKYNPSLNIIGIDSKAERCKKARDEYGIATSDSLEEVIDRQGVDCAFVCTSPLSHADIINKCLKADMHVFTELNLVDNLYDENLQLSRKNDRVLFLSSTLLYRKEIIYMREKIKQYDGTVNYMYHVGQYLPDWHPWENYKNFFVGKKETNGCREFMAIDFPWIVDTFGIIKSVNVSSSKMSNLELDYNDNYMLMFEHENGNQGVIALDVISRKASRNLEVFGENIYFAWDGSPYGLKWYDLEQKKNVNISLYESIDKRSEYADNIIEDAYYSEICNFFQVIAQKEEPKYSFEKDKEILKWIDYIENKSVR
jgi:predicted dehydrogenase